MHRFVPNCSVNFAGKNTTFKDSSSFCLERQRLQPASLLEMYILKVFGMCIFTGDERPKQYRHTASTRCPKMGRFGWMGRPGWQEETEKRTLGIASFAPQQQRPLLPVPEIPRQENRLSLCEMGKNYTVHGYSMEKNGLVSLKRDLQNCHFCKRIIPVYVC